MERYGDHRPVAQACLEIEGASSPLETAGTVLATFAALLEQLRYLETFLVAEVDEEARSALVDFMHRLSLQKNSFEDTAVELLCDVVPFAQVAAFFTALGGSRWQEVEVQARARRRLGNHNEVYCDTCAEILQSLNRIKDLADSIKPSDSMPDNELDDFDSAAWKAGLEDLWGQWNLTIVTNLQDHNLKLRNVVRHPNKARQDQIQAVNTSLQVILDLMTGPPPDMVEKLAELCQRVRKTDSDAISNASGITTEQTSHRSFQACLSGSGPCVAASSSPFETRSMLRLRWAICHLPNDNEHEVWSCCWTDCPSKALFSSSAAFLTHFVDCSFWEESKYPCLQRLEYAWYDNRCVWKSLSTRLCPQGLEVKSDVQWPHEDGNYGPRDSPSDLVVEANIHGTASGAKIDRVRYERLLNWDQGVVLARKRVQWKTSFDLANFKRESQTLSKLRHSHVIRFFGSYVQNHNYMMLLYPYCEDTLSNFMEENCQATCMEQVLGEPGLLRDRQYLQSFFPCLAQALMYIHTNTTRHADIKPDNILIKQGLTELEHGRRYHIYIADFGSASMYSSASRTKSFTATTPKYCAPELAPDPATEDPSVASEWGRAADVFSLGCVFAEMLTVLACKELVAFDLFRSERRGSGGARPSRQPRRETIDESFCKSLSRVHEWLQQLSSVADADPPTGFGRGSYWYRRGKLLAFAPWRDTFLDTIDVTASMLSEKQDGRPKIAGVVKRLDVDDCCCREVIPFFACTEQ